MTRVLLNTVAIREWAGGGSAEEVLRILGERIAADARRDAPRNTGAMADSIDYEISHDALGANVKISWDKDHFYGFFQEVGTSAQPARPFLRPAALTRRHL